MNKKRKINHKGSFHHLHHVFKKRHQIAVNKLLETHDQAVQYLLTTKVPLPELGTSSVKMLSAGVLSGALLLGHVNPLAIAAPQLPNLTTTNSDEAITPAKPVTSKEALVQQLQAVLPTNVGTLSTKQSADVSRILKANLNLNAYSELDGKKLNTDYGTMGYEQHLRRFPGDDVHLHTQEQAAGMAPKNGAFGMFANSSAALTPELKKMEEYYFAVQTFLVPGWNQNSYYLKEWFKHRKMVAVNVKTGDVVVGVVGDAGPATWTGKQFGGSPELMKDLHLDRGMRNGATLLFFVDDPNNATPLGPLN